MQELTKFSDGLEPLKPNKATESSGIFEKFLLEQGYQKPVSKPDVEDPSEPSILNTATITNDCIIFGTAIRNLTESLIKLAQSSDVKPVPPPIDADTNASLNAMKSIFSGWDGHSDFSVTQGSSDYVGGPHGEMFVHNNDTGVDTLTTSSDVDGKATIITKSKDGVVQAYTDEFNVTMQQLGDGSRLLTVTTNSEPHASVALKLTADGMGYEIVDPNDRNRHFRPLTSINDIQIFDLLVKEMIAARGAYKFDDLVEDLYSGMTIDQLSAKYRALAHIDDPLSLTLGNGTQPAIAEIVGDDDVPIYYNFCDGETSVYGLGADADFVFHDGYDVATTGARIFLANLTRGLSGPHDAERDAQIINNAVNTALAIAQQFLSGGSLDSASAIGMLQDLYGVLGSIGSIAADLAQSSVSDAINKVHNAQANILKNPGVEPKIAQMGYEPYMPRFSELARP